MRLRRTLLVVALFGLIASAPAAAQVAKRKDAGPPKGPEGARELIVSPASAPAPFFKYSLLPSSARLNPGDAAPILLRLRYNLRDEDREHLNEKASEWMQAPLRDLPLAEAAALVKARRGEFELLAIATRRATCNWNYPLNEYRRNIIEVAMADIQDLRGWGHALNVKSRVEIAMGRFDDAAKTMETGLAFSRQVGGGPFAINGLVGVALASVQLDCVEDWIAAPGSPNLYWSLTALPRPLVGLRDALEQERLIAENLIPELTDDEAPTTPEGWSLRLETIHRRIRNVVDRTSFGGADGQETAEQKRLKAALGADLAAYKRMHLPTLRKAVVDSGAFTEGQVQAMGDDEAAARGLVLGYRTVWDRLFRTMYLPFAEAVALQDETGKLIEKAQDGPFAPFVLLHPTIYMIRLAEARLDRRVALLRAVEAVRLHAASHDGALPASMDAVTEAPVPRDPATGRPFDYSIDGDAAVLAAPGLPATIPPAYRITIRTGSK